ncbi:hypothetical protein GOODEAATRI_012145 [Goodea atripinnis]|uniref:Uncharacterized protein n=1 Tax=Goodea atripinnis TaxID=208336 RepID=A0ABV0NA03_9TELE
MTAIPCACLGIFLGGLLVKKLNLSALGAVRMAMLVNLVSTACYVSFLFLGCDTGPVAGVTVAYNNDISDENVALPGKCPSPGCQHAFLTFLCVICVCSMIGAMAQTPSVIILIRYDANLNTRGSH